MQVRFGPFVLDSESRELLRDGPAVPLSPKAFDLLSILVASRPKAISKRRAAGAIVARHVRGREEPRQSGERDSRCDRRRSRQSAIHSDCSPIWVRVSRTGTIPERRRARGDVSFRLKWVTGRVTLDEGEHVLGRDPTPRSSWTLPGSRGVMP